MSNDDYLSMTRDQMREKVIQVQGKVHQKILDIILSNEPHLGKNPNDKDGKKYWMLTLTELDMSRLDADHLITHATVNEASLSTKELMDGIGSEHVMFNHIARYSMIEHTFNSLESEGQHQLLHSLIAMALKNHAEDADSLKKSLQYTIDQIDKIQDAIKDQKPHIH